MLLSWFPFIDGRLAIDTHAHDLSAKTLRKTPSHGSLEMSPARSPQTVATMSTPMAPVLVPSMATAPIVAAHGKRTTTAGDSITNDSDEWRSTCSKLSKGGHVTFQCAKGGGESWEINFFFFRNMRGPVALVASCVFCFWRTMTREHLAFLSRRCTKRIVRPWTNLIKQSNEKDSVTTPQKFIIDTQNYHT